MEINLTPQQIAKKKYYQKMKNAPTYIANRKMHCNKYYQTIKNDPVFKERNIQNQKKYNTTLNDLFFNITII